MEKNLKKLYDYCKSQGYEGSTEEFEQELESLIMEEIDSKELSKVAGGNKLTKAAAASLVSALNIVGPFASAAQNIKSNNKTIISTSKVEKGINQSKKNKKTLKDILLKGVLPVGTLVVGMPALIGTGIFIKNKIADNSPDGKTRRFLAQLLADSFNNCADYCRNASDEERRNISGRIIPSESCYAREDASVYYCGRITCLNDACYVCNAIMGNGCAVGSYPGNYNALKQFVNSKDIKESSGNFVIDNNVKSHFGCFSKIFNEQRIVVPLLICSSYLHNTELADKITEDPYVQESMQNLEQAVNELKPSINK